MPNMILVDFTIPIREDGYKKLKDLGFDFERNISRYLRDVYFEILRAEEEKEVQ